MAPAPNRFHQDISRNLQFELHSYLKSNPIGKLYDGPFDVYLDEYNAFQPDLVIVLNEHAGILTKREKKSSRGGHGGHGGYLKSGSQWLCCRALDPSEPDLGAALHGKRCGSQNKNTGSLFFGRSVGVGDSNFCILHSDFCLLPLERISAKHHAEVRGGTQRDGFKVCLQVFVAEAYPLRALAFLRARPKCGGSRGDLCHLEDERALN
jgi:Putative restriction endonuclease